MSYCRWSCDDFRCDIYAYESNDGYEIHVAGNRIVGDIPHVPFILDVDADEWRAAYQAQHDFLATAQREPITLPHAGESFCESDLEDLAARLIMLRELGYRFPDHVLETIAEEAIEVNV